jgi:preprotein translocase subunit SecE
MLRVRILPGLHFLSFRFYQSIPVILLKALPENKECRLKKIFSFLKESRAELKKVNWPSREEVLTSTRVVIISILIIAAVVALMDYVIKTIIFSIMGG